MTTIVFDLEDGIAAADQKVEYFIPSHGIIPAIKNLFHGKLSFDRDIPDGSSMCTGKVLKIYSPGLGEILVGASGDGDFADDLIACYAVHGTTAAWDDRDFFYSSKLECTILVMTKDEIRKYHVKNRKNGDVAWTESVYKRGGTISIVGCGSGWAEAITRLAGRDTVSLKEVCRMARYFDPHTSQQFIVQGLEYSGHTKVYI